jgi:hypothetical protein
MGHEDPDGARWGWVVKVKSHFTGGWMYFGGGLDGYGKSHPHRGSNHGPSGP